MLKKEIIVKQHSVKMHSVRYNQETKAESPGDGGFASFYIPNWILEKTRPKVLKITIEEVSE
jgi:hypothetical protein